MKTAGAMPEKNKISRRKQRDIGKPEVRINSPGF